MCWGVGTLSLELGDTQSPYILARSTVVSAVVTDVSTVNTFYYLALFWLISRESSFLDLQTSSCVLSICSITHLERITAFILCRWHVCLITRVWTRWGNPSSRCRNKRSGQPRVSRKHQSYGRRCSAIHSCTSSRMTSSCMRRPTFK